MQKVTTTAAGVLRNYYILSPAMPESRPKTLFFFKGKGGDLLKLERVFKPFCDKYNFRMIFPEAQKVGKTKLFDIEAPVMDVMFVDEIMKTEGILHSDLRISGVSNGGCFALFLTTMGYPKKVVTFAASIWDETWGYISLGGCDLRAYHGQDDTSVPYNGGPAHGVTFLSALQSLSALLPGKPITLSKGAVRDKYEITDGIDSAILYSYPLVGHEVFGVVDLNEVFTFLNS